MSVYAKAVAKWGHSAQLLMMAEECSELAAAAIRVVNRNRPGAEINLCEEIADVEIMCEQARAMGFSDMIDEFKSEKIKRLERRVAEPEGER